MKKREKRKKQRGRERKAGKQGGKKKGKGGKRGREETRTAKVQYYLLLFLHNRCFVLSEFLAELLVLLQVNTTMYILAP